jgi:CRP-like cAMP-binding protein
LNHLCDRLTRKDAAALQLAGEPHALLAGDVLHKGGAPLQHVYFPDTGFVSLLVSVAGTPALEVGMVGREGMVGAHLVLGVAALSAQVLVQGEGVALRVRSAAFGRVLAASPALQDRLRRYLHVRMEQLAGIAPCLRFHRIEARLARWLLMSHDRAGVADFKVKQEFLAYMLGVRRAGINEAAGALQDRALIRYSRGMLNVIDRAGLEAAACPCYAADRACYLRQLGDPFGARRARRIL